jgi:hypothetical protein
MLPAVRAIELVKAVGEKGVEKLETADDESDKQRLYATDQPVYLQRIRYMLFATQIHCDYIQHPMTRSCHDSDCCLR